MKRKLIHVRPPHPRRSCKGIFLDVLGIQVGSSIDPTQYLAHLQFLAVFRFVQLIISFESLV